MVQKTATSLFLSQSYQDAWDDYKQLLAREDSARWDYIVLTASDEQQAAGFRAQLEQRSLAGFLPSGTHFAVIPDPEGKRVGSGGATLGVLRYIAKHRASNDFSGLRILVIHSGGDSKRVPQYSALGKLFSPVPRQLPNGRASTLFDEFMISMSSVAGRIREGMLLLSGDVLLLFNPLQIDYSGEGAAAISFKEHVQTGKNHGVFLRGANGMVSRFLHKQTVESLRQYGAVNDRDCVDIDTGAVIFSSKMLCALHSLVQDEEGFQKYVNDTLRLSLYGDFLYPLAAEATLEDYFNEKPEGGYSPELTEARQILWKTLRPFRMKLLRLAPAKFIHFGTTKEILQLMGGEVEDYGYLGWSRTVCSSIVHENVAGYCSALSANATCGSNCYLEVSYVHSGAKLGDNVVLSYIDVHQETIPSNVVVHGLKQRDGQFVVRIYGVEDNPKENNIFGISVEEFTEKNGISDRELWDGGDKTLWTAKLYPVCATIPEALAAALNVYRMSRGEGDVESWRKAARKSLQSGFGDADPQALIAWDKRMQELVRMEGLKKLIGSGMPASESARVLQSTSLTPIQQQWLDNNLSRSSYSQKMRLHYYLGTALGGAEGDRHIRQSFRCIRQAVLDGTMEGLVYRKDCRIVADRHSVQLPLRVNWGGGWSDTPPYCYECGGTVLNAAIALNGQLPVEVTLTRIPEQKVVFDSRDMDVHGEFERLSDLQNTGDPYDPFALQKAALLACGVIPAEGGDLGQILARLGGGFRMQTEVTGVPKGSGLGTSSILAAACVKAIFGFLGIEYTQDALYSHVLAMEQIMSTGGGWQDQVGGLAEGVKLISSAPGLKQQLRVRQVQIPEEALEELRQRFALIYTGQRRLARNLLRDVVGRYIGNDPEALYALNEIQRVAALMAFELERGNVDAFAELLSRHWELSKKVDAGSTNTLIDQIFGSVEDLIDGKMICGAGGGGFLQVVLKKGVTCQQVQQRLKNVFLDSDIGLWNCTIL